MHLLVIEGRGVGRAGVELDALVLGDAAHQVAATGKSAGNVCLHQGVNGSVVGVHTDNIAAHSVESVQGRAVLGDRSRGLGALGHSRLGHGSHNAGACGGRLCNKVLGGRVDSRGQACGLLGVGLKRHLQELGCALVNDALAAVAGQAVTNGHGKCPIANVGAGNGHNVGLRVVFQGDGGRRAAGAAAREIAAGNTAGKHFGDKILSVAAAKHSVHVGGRLKCNGPVQRAPVCANDAHADAVQRTGNLAAANAITPVVNARAGLGFAHRKGTSHNYFTSLVANAV